MGKTAENKCKSVDITEMKLANFVEGKEVAALHD